MRQARSKRASVAASEEGPSRRELLVQGSKVAAGIGVAALLGNLGNWALSYAAGKEPIKVGVLHSLSGTMAISEVSLRDVCMMAVEEINAKGGVLGRRSSRWSWTRPRTGTSSPRRPSSCCSRTRSRSCSAAGPR